MALKDDLGPFDSGGLDQADSSAACWKTLPAGLAASEATSHRAERQDLPLAFLQILCAGLQEKNKALTSIWLCFRHSSRFSGISVRPIPWAKTIPATGPSGREFFAAPSMRPGCSGKRLESVAASAPFPRRTLSRDAAISGEREAIKNAPPSRDLSRAAGIGREEKSISAHRNRHLLTRAVAGRKPEAPFTIVTERKQPPGPRRPQRLLPRTEVWRITCPCESRKARIVSLMRAIRPSRLIRMGPLSAKRPSR